jgi:hypothetical protein
MATSLPTLPFGQSEYSIHEPVFKLYGEDLRCLESLRPMMAIIWFNRDINPKSAIGSYSKMLTMYEKVCIYACAIQCVRNSMRAQFNAVQTIFS